jgi:hypothetical protein
MSLCPGDRTKLLFPDACWAPNVVSGALFLYFHDEKLTFTLHPSVSTHLTGANPFDFIKFVESANPDWLPQFSKFLSVWASYQSSLRATREILEPLRGAGLSYILMAYPKDAAAWGRSEDIIASSELGRTRITKLIDPFSASDELFAHIFFEKYLELYEETRDLYGMADRDTTTIVTDIQNHADVDWRALYGYCDKLFHAAELEDLFTTAYMFRLPILQHVPSVLITNPNLIGFLSSLPVDATRKSDKDAMHVDLDVVAWEFFRQLVSPALDPLDKHAVGKLLRIIQRHSADIDALKRRCFSLAQELGNESDLGVLQRRIAQHIRGKVEREVQAVLSLDKKAVKALFETVFSDEKTWIGIATFLYSLTTGGAALTAGAAIYALSSVGSKAFKAAADRCQKLKATDYALLYRMK